MADTLPPSLASLLAATGAKRDEAWNAFLEVYSERILKVARSLPGDDDAVMDRYLFVLEDLMGEDFRRLRVYAPHPGARFSTWLSIVVRRLCLDHHRKKYGRVPGPGRNPADDPAKRRRLVDLVGSEFALSHLTTPRSDDPDLRLERVETRDALATALASRSPRDRLLLALRFEEELTAKEIAGFMRFPTVFHVYRRLNKVLAQLRRELEQRGVER